MYQGINTSRMRMIRQSKRLTVIGAVAMTCLVQGEAADEAPEPAPPTKDKAWGR